MSLSVLWFVLSAVLTSSCTDISQAMGDWCSEEQLIAFGKEGDAFLNGGNGIRRPKGDKMWLDVLAGKSSDI